MRIVNIERTSLTEMEVRGNTNSIFDTQDVIVSAIRKDFNNINISIADYKSPVIEREDPLGMAFYAFAILETGYISQDFVSTLEPWKYWAESRLEIDIPSVYFDTELSSLGLILYALSLQQVSPENSSNFYRLADDHFSQETGIYDNFMATILVGLGVGSLEKSEPLFSNIQNYLNLQIQNDWKNIFNDPKNFIVAYLWSKRTKDERLRKKLRLEAFDRYQHSNFLVRDMCYLAYILFEEIEEFSHSERREIKVLVEKSLRFIRDYMSEKNSDLSSSLISEVGRDIALEDADMWDLYGYPSKPILSRILLSVGLLIERRYRRSPYLFDGFEQWFNRIVFSLFFFSLFFLLSVTSFWGWGNAGFSNEIKTGFGTKQFLPILLSILSALISSVVLVFGLSSLYMAFATPYFFVKSLQSRTFDVLTESWRSLTLKIALVEIAIAISINIFTALS